jgi:protein O-mannose beta-1,4-N-acetylglucosaminyltransferase
MEDQSLTQQIMTLRSTMVAVGLHGSALILGIFLPPGAVLVEMFPYAVPPENYTPYKTMAQLDGMRIVYKTWVNKHKENNRAHPNRQPELGGLKHLDKEERQRIEDMETVPPHLCCRNPIWLYRIYQDTIVHIEELIATIDSGLIEAAEQIRADDRAFYTMSPAAPDHVECEVNPRLQLGSKEAAEAEENPLDMTIRWSRPWNGVATNKFGVWIHQHFAEFFAINATHIVLEECSPGTTYDIWVRAYSAQDAPGLYTEKYQCSCAIGATATKVEKSAQKQ